MNLNLTLIGQSLSMMVFVWLCMKYIWPPIMDALNARSKTIADGLAAADQGVKDLEQAQTKADDMLTEARSQAAVVLEQAQQRQNKIIDQAKQEANAEKLRLKAAASVEIEQDAARAREGLRKEVAALAVLGAQRILERELDVSTHKDLLDKLVLEI